MNWTKLIYEIKVNFGISDAKVAEKVGSTQPTIYQLRKGYTSQPYWDLGEKLVRLHEKSEIFRDEI